MVTAWFFGIALAASVARVRGMRTQAPPTNRILVNATKPPQRLPEGMTWIMKSRKWQACDNIPWNCNMSPTKSHMLDKLCNIGNIASGFHCPRSLSAAGARKYLAVFVDLLDSSRAGQTLMLGLRQALCRAHGSLPVVECLPSISLSAARLELKGSVDTMKRDSFCFKVKHDLTNAESFCGCLAKRLPLESSWDMELVTEELLKADNQHLLEGCDVFVVETNPTEPDPTEGQASPVDRCAGLSLAKPEPPKLCAVTWNVGVEKYNIGWGGLRGTQLYTGLKRLLLKECRDASVIALSLQEGADPMVTRYLTELSESMPAKLQISAFAGSRLLKGRTGHVKEVEPTLKSGIMIKYGQVLGRPHERDIVLTQTHLITFKPNSPTDPPTNALMLGSPGFLIHIAQDTTSPVSSSCLRVQGFDDLTWPNGGLVTFKFCTKDPGQDIREWQWWIVFAACRRRGPLFDAWTSSRLASPDVEADKQMKRICQTHPPQQLRMEMQQQQQLQQQQQDHTEEKQEQHFDAQPGLQRQEQDHTAEEHEWYLESQQSWHSQLISNASSDSGWSSTSAFDRESDYFVGDEQVKLRFAAGVSLAVFADQPLSDVRLFSVDFTAQAAEKSNWKESVLNNLRWLTPTTAHKGGLITRFMHMTYGRVHCIATVHLEAVNRQKRHYQANVVRQALQQLECDEEIWMGDFNTRAEKPHPASSDGGHCPLEQVHLFAHSGDTSALHRLLLDTDDFRQMVPASRYKEMPVFFPPTFQKLYYRPGKVDECESLQVGSLSLASFTPHGRLANNEQFLDLLKDSSRSVSWTPRTPASTLLKANQGWLEGKHAPSPVDGIVCWEGEKTRESCRRGNCYVASANSNCPGFTDRIVFRGASLSPCDYSSIKGASFAGADHSPVVAVFHLHKSDDEPKFETMPDTKELLVTRRIKAGSCL